MGGNSDPLVMQYAGVKQFDMPSNFVISNDGNDESGGNDVMAICIIFIGIAIICGMVCFITGSGVAGIIGYRQGKKSVKTKRKKTILDEEPVNEI